MDPFLVVVEGGLCLQPTCENGRLQGITVQCGESKQCQIGQLCVSESRIEPTSEQPTNSAGNTPHDYSLSKLFDLGYTQIWWG